MSDAEFLDWVEQATAYGTTQHAFTGLEAKRLRRLAGRTYSPVVSTGPYVLLGNAAMRYVRDARKRITTQVIERLTS